jgi:hypothetical protein
LFILRLEGLLRQAGTAERCAIAPTWDGDRTQSGAFQTCFICMGVGEGMLIFAICLPLSDVRPKLPEIYFQSDDCYGVASGLWLSGLMNDYFLNM